MIRFSAISRKLPKRTLAVSGSPLSRSSSSTSTATPCLPPARTSHRAPRRRETMLQVATQPNIAQLVTPQPPSESLATAHTQQCIQLDPYSVAQQPTTAQNVDPSPDPQNTAPPGNTQAAPVIVPVHEIILAKQVRSYAFQLCTCKAKIRLAPGQASPSPSCLDSGLGFIC